MGKRKIKNELMNVSMIEKCARSFGMIGDKTRLKICYLLCRYPELSVGVISEILGFSISATSRALKKLNTFQVTKNRRNQKRILYSLGKTRLTRYRAYPYKNS